MEELHKAIKVQWETGTALKAKATGGLHPVEAPQGTEGPYVVYFPLPGNVADTMTTKIEEAAIQFSIFVTTDDGGAKTATQIRDLLVALYDDVLLTMGDGNTMFSAARQTSGYLLKDPDEGYALHVDYVFQYDK